MSDLIRREDAIKCLDGNILIRGRNEAEAVKEYFEMVVNRLEAIPSAEPKVGRNVKEEWNSLFKCSVCGWECGDTYMCDTATFNYCPNCGAKMERSE